MVVTVDEIYKEYLWGRRLKQFIGDAAGMIDKEIVKGNRVLFETAKEQCWIRYLGHIRILLLLTIFQVGFRRESGFPL